MTVFIERENGDLLSLEGVKTSDGEPEFLIVQSVKDYGPQNILSITGGREMKFPERWHKWPEETPPENEPLQVEVWNDFHEEYELAVGVFHEGGFFQHNLGELALSQRLFIHEQKQVFWRLWEGEDEE